MRELIVKAVLAGVAAATAPRFVDQVADGNVDLTLLEHVGWSALAAMLMVVYHWSKQERDNG